MREFMKSNGAENHLYPQPGVVNVMIMHEQFVAREGMTAIYTAVSVAFRDFVAPHWETPVRLHAGMGYIAFLHK